MTDNEKMIWAATYGAEFSRLAREGGIGGNSWRQSAFYASETAWASVWYLRVRMDELEGEHHSGFGFVGMAKEMVER